MVERRNRPDLLTFDRVNDAGDLEPEIDDTRENSRVVMHHVDRPRPPGCVSALTPVGWALVYKLRDHLASSESPPHFRNPSRNFARQVINVTLVAMERLVNGHVSYATHPNPTSFVRCLAGCIKQILLRLQTELVRPSRWLTCLCCQQTAVTARRLCSRAYKLEVRGRIRNGTVRNAVSILPPMSDRDPPRLCLRHQIIFTRLLYRTVLPIRDWDGLEWCDWQHY